MANIKPKRTRTVAAIGLSSLMALSLVTVATVARAVVFNIGVPDGVAGVDMDTTSALYASGRDELATLVAQLGAIAPGGDVFEDLGVPSISPEGDVVFGAATVGQDQRPRWDIYRANAGDSGQSAHRICARRSHYAR